jgi:hypothetical protein
MDIPKSFIWITVLFDKDFKYGDGAKFLGYVGTNAEPFISGVLNISDTNMAAEKY